MFQPIYEVVKRGKKMVRIRVGWHSDRTTRTPSVTPARHAAAYHLAAHPWLGYTNPEQEW